MQQQASTDCPQRADADRWRRVHLAGDRNPPIRLIRGKVFAFPAKGEVLGK